jgi:putative transposase
MKKTRYTSEQIIGILNQTAAEPITEVCRRNGTTATTFYRWRAKYGNLQVAEARRLEDENRRLKRLVADLSLDNAMLKDVVGREW